MTQQSSRKGYHPRGPMPISRPILMTILWALLPLSSFCSNSGRCLRRPLSPIFSSGYILPRRVMRSRSTTKRRASMTPWWKNRRTGVDGKNRPDSRPTLHAAAPGIQNGEIDPSFVITNRLSLEDAPRAYETFLHKQDGCIKVVLKPHETYQ